MRNSGPMTPRFRITQMAPNSSASTSRVHPATAMRACVTCSWAFCSELMTTKAPWVSPTFQPSLVPPTTSG